MVQIAEYVCDLASTIYLSGTSGVNLGVIWDDLKFPNTSLFTIDGTDNSRINILNSGLYRVSYNIVANKTAGTNEFVVVQCTPVHYTNGNRLTLKAGSALMALYKVDVTEQSMFGSFLLNADADDVLTLEVSKLFDDDNSETMKLISNRSLIILEKLN